MTSVLQKTFLSKRGGKMGFSSTMCYRNEIGKILAKLRVDYGESQAKQAERLGVSMSYISMVGSGKRNFSYELYKSILEHYYSVDKYKDSLDELVIGEERKKRFLSVFSKITNKEILYILYGESLC